MLILYWVMGNIEQGTHCPLCHEPLEVRDVGPCMGCGSDPHEIDEARAGRHIYTEWRIFGDLSLVLCDFCSSNFDSFDPTFLGLPYGTRVGMDSPPGWQFIRDIQPFITKDQCCARCGYRLPFLEFVAHARELHSQRKDVA